MPTRRALEVLAEMAAATDRGDHDDAEIVCDGAACWLGVERLSRRTVDVLLRHVAISLVSEPGSLERFTINQVGRNVLVDREVAGRIRDGLAKGIPMDSWGNPV